MIVTFSSRHMPVTEPLKTYATEKANKLNKYFDRISEIEVVVEHEDHDGSPMRVEMIVNADHHKFVAHGSDADVYGCIDAVVNKLERQLTDHKERHRNRKHPEA